MFSLPLEHISNVSPTCSHECVNVNISSPTAGLACSIFAPRDRPSESWRHETSEESIEDTMYMYVRVQNISEISLTKPFAIGHLDGETSLA